jgi:hypothetical protein
MKSTAYANSGPAKLSRGNPRGSQANPAFHARLNAPPALHVGEKRLDQTRAVLGRDEEPRGASREGTESGESEERVREAEHPTTNGETGSASRCPQSDR